LIQGLGSKRWKSKKKKDSSSNDGSCDGKEVKRIGKMPTKKKKKGDKAQDVPKDETSSESYNSKQRKVSGAAQNLGRSQRLSFLRKAAGKENAVKD